jgi:hypothetical protein
VRSRVFLWILLSILAEPGLVWAADPGTSPVAITAVPPLELRYIQYGVALTAEVVTAPGPICGSNGAPCILGSGGGIAGRGGIRFPGAWYFGGSYEFSKQDPSQLYRLAILQQLRAEGRYYFVTSRATEPYLSATAGAFAYGNAWAVDLWGPMASLGAGVEFQITRTRVIGIGMTYRLLYTTPFTDSANTHRDAGIAQILGIDIVLEARDPL